MAKDRNKSCVFYVAEGQCKKGREGTFYGYCQRCNLYECAKNTKAARVTKKQREAENRHKNKKINNYDY